MFGRLRTSSTPVTHAAIGKGFAIGSAAGGYIPDGCLHFLLLTTGCESHPGRYQPHDLVGVLVVPPYPICSQVC